MEHLYSTDGYKLDHRRQYPEGTEYIYSTWTPRYSMTDEKEVVFFGLQYFLEKYLGELQTQLQSGDKQTILVTV